jgi:hypothetical protein
VVPLLSINRSVNQSINQSIINRPTHGMQGDSSKASWPRSISIRTSRLGPPSVAAATSTPESEQQQLDLLWAGQERGTARTTLLGGWLCDDDAVKGRLRLSTPSFALVLILEPSTGRCAPTNQTPSATAALGDRLIDPLRPLFGLLLHSIAVRLTHFLLITSHRQISTPKLPKLKGAMSDCNPNEAPWDPEPDPAAVAVAAAQAQHRQQVARLRARNAQLEKRCRYLFYFECIIALVVRG